MLQMTAARNYLPQLTPAEYLEWEARQEFRHEYVDGEVYAMTGGSVNHGEIAANFITILRSNLQASGCRVLTSDVKVEVMASKSFLYPDISVTCNDRDRTATKFISNPCLIVEILSPSTEAYDRGDKFKLYRRSTSLQEYVLVDTNEISVDLYRRTQQNRWELISYVAGDSVELESINLTFPIERIFENIIFDNSAIN
jgi:Uma2 family endonuclease